MAIIFNKWIDNNHFAVSDYEDSAFVDLRKKKKRKPGTCKFNTSVLNTKPGAYIHFVQ
jgi:hypothetical protein